MICWIIELSCLLAGIWIGRCLANRAFLQLIDKAFPKSPHSPTAEATDLKSAQSEFKSQCGEEL